MIYRYSTTYVRTYVRTCSSAYVLQYFISLQKIINCARHANQTNERNYDHDCTRRRRLLSLERSCNVCVVPCSTRRSTVMQSPTLNSQRRSTTCTPTGRRGHDAYGCFSPSSILAPSAAPTQVSPPGSWSGSGSFWIVTIDRSRANGAESGGGGGGSRAGAPWCRGHRHRRC